MKIDTKQITTALSSLQRNVTMAQDDQRRFIAMVVAKAVAYSLPLPAQRVESVRQYYLSNAEEIAKVVIAEINEAFVFDVRTALSMTFQVYRARYAVVHDPRAADLHTLVDAIIRDDQSGSIEPGYRGIFERVTESDAQSRIDDVANWVYAALNDSGDLGND